MLTFSDTDKYFIMLRLFYVPLIVTQNLGHYQNLSVFLVKEWEVFLKANLTISALNDCISIEIIMNYRWNKFHSLVNTAIHACRF